MDGLVERCLVVGPLGFVAAHHRTGLVQTFGRLLPRPVERGTAGGHPDELGLLLGVPAAQRPDPEGAVGPDGGRGAARRVTRDRFEQLGDQILVHLPYELVRERHGEVAAQRARYATGDDGDQITAGQFDGAAVEQPGREQPRGFERRLDPCPLGVTEMRHEVDQVGKAVVGGALPSEPGRVGLGARRQFGDERLRLPRGLPLAG